MDMENSGNGLLLRLKPHYRTIAVTTAVLAAILAVYVFAIRTPRQNNGMPASITSEVSGFRVYYPETLGRGFTLQSDASYASGVLVFSMKNLAGKTLVFTEQATPDGFDISQIKSDSKFSTEYGRVYIVDAPDRTTGALFSSDKTWVLINAPKPVGSTIMREVLEKLVPQSS